LLLPSHEGLAAAEMSLTLILDQKMLRIVKNKITTCKASGKPYRHHYFGDCTKAWCSCFGQLEPLTRTFTKITKKSETYTHSYSDE
jgi:hypothetical protein